MVNWIYIIIFSLPILTIVRNPAGKKNLFYKYEEATKIIHHFNGEVFYFTY